MEEVAIQVEADINPTEDAEKVKNAILNIFDIVSVEIKPSYRGNILTAKAKGIEALVQFRNLLSLDRIRAAARKVFLGGLRGNNIRFFLNKQVAFTGHVSFSEENGESPLGPMKITFECKDPKTLIDWLAPTKA